METVKTTRDVYLHLTEHNLAQVIVFLCLLFGSMTFFFVIIWLPTLDSFFQGFLHAKVLHNGDSGTSLLFRWLINVTSDSGNETQYLLNPFLSFLPFSLCIGLGISFYISALLPRNIGYIHQKIQREIVNALDKAARIIYHEHAEGEHLEVENKLLDLDLRLLHEYAELHHIDFDDLETLSQALRWRRLTGFKSVFQVHNAIRLYMRQYFTITYSNNVLGIVYIGAAVLIVVIGLRGLKFLPASEPSVIIFALGLEFVLLISYALTVMYTKEEEVGGIKRDNSFASSGTNSVLEHLTASLESFNQHKDSFSDKTPETLNSREVENLLRIFINKSRKKDADNK